MPNLLIWALMFGCFLTKHYLCIQENEMKWKSFMKDSINHCSRWQMAVLSMMVVLGATAQSRHVNVGIGISGGCDSTKVSYFNLSLLSNTDEVRGAQIGMLINGASGEMHGVQLSAVSNVAKKVKGLQLAGFTNTARQLQGVQLAGITNISMGVRGGLQLSGVANVCASTMSGVETAMYNYADTLSGVQLGLINVCHCHDGGVQVGIINLSTDTIARKIGLVNVNPKTKIDLLLSVGTSSKSNVAVRFRNRSTYNIIGVGTHYMGLDEKFSGALFYRIGQYFDVSPRLSLSGDIGYYHIETFTQHSEQKPERLYSLQARMNIDYRLGKTLGTFLSVGYGDTRYYYHAQHYRNRFLAEAGLSLSFK